MSKTLSKYFRRFIAFFISSLTLFPVYVPSYVNASQEDTVTTMSADYEYGSTGVTNSNFNLESISFDSSIIFAGVRRVSQDFYIINYTVRENGVMNGITLNFGGNETNNPELFFYYQIINKIGAPLSDGESYEKSLCFSEIFDGSTIIAEVNDENKITISFANSSKLSVDLESNSGGTIKIENLSRLTLEGGVNTGEPATTISPGQSTILWYSHASGGYEGDNIKITAEPILGYELKELKIVDAKGSVIRNSADITATSGTISFVFESPSDFEIIAVFEEIQAGVPSVDGGFLAGEGIISTGSNGGSFVNPTKFTTVITGSQKTNPILSLTGTGLELAESVKYFANISGVIGDNPVKSSDFTEDMEITGQTITGTLKTGSSVWLLVKTVSGVELVYVIAVTVNDRITVTNEAELLDAAQKGEKEICIDGSILLNSSVTIPEGTTLIVTTGGELFLGDSSSIGISDGASLLIESGASMSVADGAELITDDGGTFTVNGFLFVYPGGYAKISENAAFETGTDNLGGCIIEVGSRTPGISQAAELFFAGGFEIDDRAAVRILNGGVIRIEEDKTLSIGGSLTIENGGRIVLEDDASLIAQNLFGGYAGSGSDGIVNKNGDPIQLDDDGISFSAKTFIAEFYDGSVILSTSYVVSGSYVSKPANPAKGGYSFAGWYKEAEFINLWDFENDRITGNIKIYAKWVLGPPVYYEVSFETYGGTAIDSYSIQSGSLVSRPINPIKNGYSFAGWYKEAELINLWDFGNDQVLGNVTLYAKWVLGLPANYTVSFETNGGTAINSYSVQSGSLVSRPINPIKNGYSFAGWYKEAELINLWDFGNDQVLGNITLYAKWVLGSSVYYIVSFETYGGTVENSYSVQSGSLVSRPINPVKSGYSFAGWYKEEGLINLWDFENNKVLGNITLYAKWVLGSSVYYSVSFETNGGATLNSYSIQSGSFIARPADPAKDGNYFAGWYKEAAYTNIWDFTSDKITGNITLYAKWIAISNQNPANSYYSNEPVQPLKGDNGQNLAPPISGLIFEALAQNFGYINVMLAESNPSVVISGREILTLIDLNLSLKVTLDIMTIEFTPETLLAAGFNKSGSVEISMVHLPQSKIDEYAAGLNAADAGLNAVLLKYTCDITVRADGKIVDSFSSPLNLTCDLSRLGLRLSDYQARNLTVVRFINDTPSNLGDVYESKTKTLTTETTHLSVYGLLSADNLRRLTMTVGNSSYLINGITKTADTAPMIIDGRTMVPARFFAEALGAFVVWDENSRSVTISLDNRILLVTIGQILPGMDVPAQIINGRTMIPLRYIANMLGINVIWDPLTQSVRAYK